MSQPTSPDRRSRHTAAFGFIFAASLMAFPPTIGQLSQANWAQNVAAFFSPNGWAFVVGEAFFILVFTYFYTAVTFNPVDQADNLKKYGGFIPGVRPGRPTAEYLDRILARLTFPGALFLAAVAALPTILFNQTSASFYFGGTSILIVIGVALDTMKQMMKTHLDLTLKEAVTYLKADYQGSVNAYEQVHLRLRNGR